jgi:hypothetical protein
MVAKDINDHKIPRTSIIVPTTGFFDIELSPSIIPLDSKKTI